MALILNLDATSFHLTYNPTFREKKKKKKKKTLNRKISKNFNNLIWDFLICRWLQTILKRVKLLREQPYSNAKSIHISFCINV